MSGSRSLPVLLPKVPDQRWNCHSCSDCCRTLVVNLFDDEKRRLDEQGWREKLGIDPSVRIGHGWVLNKHADGACVFLDQDNRCRIHSELGKAAKPLACRIFPFSVRPVLGGWQASLRFDCPSVASSRGQPIGAHRGLVRGIAAELPRGGARDEDTAMLRRGLRATPAELRTLVEHYLRRLRHDAVPFPCRLMGAVKVTQTLQEAKLRSVRAERFTELLDLLFAALPFKMGEEPSSPTPRQRGLLRQLAFAHAEHVTLAQMREGILHRWRRRWSQLRSAGRFRRGAGTVPTLPGMNGSASFDAVEKVLPAEEDSVQVNDLLLRYLTARLEGRSVFGEGYYGWHVFPGLGALWLSVAVAGWLARYAAVLDDRSHLSFSDVAKALGMVDRAATRLPALGGASERARLSYLSQKDGVARLIHHYRLTEEPA